MKGERVAGRSRWAWEDGPRPVDLHKCKSFSHGRFARAARSPLGVL